MIKVSKKLEYALMAIKYLYEQDAQKRTSVREICDHLGTPFDTTSRVLQLLVGAHYVTSIQGAHGGYAVNPEIRQLTFKDLAQIIEGKVATVKCMSNPSSCSLIDQCNILNPIEILEEKVNGYLASLTLGDFLLRNSKQQVSALG